MSSKDNDEERVMQPKIDNIELMIYVNAGEFIEELFKSRLNRYQVGSKHQ